MNTSNPFPSAAPDFSDPLGLLRACHERIFRHCDTLEKLPTHIAEKGADREFREAVAKIHRYFTTAAKHHHADEERDLFPLLVRRSLDMADTIDRLKQEHEHLDALWKDLEPLLAKPSTIKDPPTLETPARHFAEANRNHAQKENEEILDVVRHLFSNEDIKKLGRSMAERRGVSLPSNF
ncbi:MAG: hemerythrin domain-containing protein [Pseudomonadota bacterium]